MEKRIRAKDELYDVSMLRGYGCKNDGYGELLGSFSKQLAEVLNISATHKVLDVGSGIGFLCFDLACLSGCSVKGIEIRRDLYLKSVQIARHVAERMRMDVSFIYGDATGDSFDFKNMDIIICGNTLWSDENNYRLLQKLCVQMRPGTRVVVLEQLGGQRYHEKSARHRNDILSSCFELPPQKHMSEPGSVSWTSNSIPFYVYTKKKITRDLKERLEKDRGNLLNAPKHRTDPHVVSFRGKKRAVVDEEGLEEDLEELESLPARKRVRTEAKPRSRPVTRSAQLEDAKPSQVCRRKTRGRAKLTMPRRRVSSNPITRSGALRTRAQVKQNKATQKREKQQRQSKQQEQQKQSEPITPRQTRAQARAQPPPTSPPSLPSPTPTVSTRMTRSQTANSPPSSDPPLSLPLPKRSAKRNFAKTSFQRPALKEITNENADTSVDAQKQSDL
jgi:SAM-dependent methyltransferase